MTNTLTHRAEHAPSETGTPPASGRLRALGYAVLALCAYVPILSSSPGRVVADTKSYLYLDPGRLLERAPSMWDPSIGLGTVTHQNLGYLFPMGPYYWLTHELGVPVWVAQRFWLGTVMLFAALGMLFLLRTLHVTGPGVVAAALVFMLTPYTLTFASRLSVILLPWAALPWMLALTIRALRDPRGWRYPAIFAVVVQVVGSVNATALVFAGIAPVLWVLYAVFVTAEIAWRRAIAVVAKIALLTVLASLWWIVGLAVQSNYGLDILRFTETLETVAHASLPSEVLRGLGYWFFYGGDKIGYWVESSSNYTQSLWLLVVSFTIPALAILAAVFVRWRHRAYFVLLAFVGFVIAVGANPYDDPSTVGALFKDFAAESNFGFALRSTGRAVPLLVLGLAVLLGVGVNALARHLAGRGLAAAGIAIVAIVVVLAAVNLPSWWNGETYSESLQRDEEVPGYWSDAIAALDARPHDTRILEIPGADFAAYRWGGTVDPITPGLTDRPYVARELVPWGSQASADLLNALDRRFQEGVLEPEALAPIARLMSVGDVVYRADLETDRFDLVRAVPGWALLTRALADGLGEPDRFGDDLGPPLTYTQLDEVALALPPDASVPPPVSVFPVEQAQPIVRTASASTPLLVSGDGEGLVDLASIGALDGTGVVLYSGSYAGDRPGLRAQVAEDGSVLVVTDANRKRGRRWGAIRDVQGPTERVDESPLTKDERDARLDLFPGAGADAQTVVVTTGASVDTTRTGNVIIYWPEMRGQRAFDGDVDTAWLVGDHASVIGEKIRVDLDEPITTDRVNLVQPLVGPRDRHLTQITMSFDGDAATTVDLDDASRTPDGQTVTFPRRTFQRLELGVADTNVGDRFDYPASNNVGFAEIRLRDDAPGSEDVRVEEVVRMPTDLVDAAGPRASARPLVYAMSRSRNVVIPPRLSQDEDSLVREFRVPDGREFSGAGTVRLATAAPDHVIDAALGIPDATAGGITVRASEHLPGAIAARGSSALDGDAATAWSTAFGDPAGEWIEVEAPAPITVDHLDLEVVADGRHSVPTSVVIEGGGERREVDLPAVADRAEPGATAPVPVTFPAITGDRVRVTVAGVRPTTTTEYHENQPIVMPVAVAELGVPGVARSALPAVLPPTCRSDVLRIDDVAVGVRLVGDTSDAASGGAIDFELCAASPGAPSTVPLGRGDHLARSTPGETTGLDIDRLVLGSDAGGEPLALGPGGSISAMVRSQDGAAGETPRVRVVEDGRTQLRLEVAGAERGVPFWLVLGQSFSDGWHASVEDGAADGPRLVDGFANGWMVDPPGGTFTITLEWTPQRQVWIALAISAVTVVACLVLVVWSRRRRGSTRDVGAQLADIDGTAALASPLEAEDGTVGTAALVLGPLVAAFVSGMAVRWWVGLVVGAAVLAVLMRRRLRPLLTIGALGAAVLTAAYVVIVQQRHDYLHDFFWLTHFDRIQMVAWLAISLLAADAFVELLRTPRRVGGAPPRSSRRRRRRGRATR